MDTKSPIFLSVIIPAYNEQSRIADSVYEIKDYLAAQSYCSELMIVDDGSSDLTLEVIRVIDIYRKTFKEQQSSEIIENIKNVGKGFTIACGMLKARGELILFSDADLSTPIEEIEKLLPHIEEGNDLVIGSRRMADSVVENKSFNRKLMSFVFNCCVRLLAIKDIQDTQCGFKLYRRQAAREIARLQKVFGFGFDIEHLFLAQRLGYGIKEVAANWQDKTGSTVDPVFDSLRMLFDLARIRFLHRRLP